MKILDLDLDYFLDRITFDRAEREDCDAIPWSEEEVREFLEKQCGLSKERPISGRVVMHHNEAFLWWRELILQDDLTAPFEIVHVDSHSDLYGWHRDHYKYIMEELLAKDLDDRIYPEAEKITIGNYLLIALSCRWIKKLTYVYHDKYDTWQPDDLFPMYFKDWDIRSGYLQLRNYPRGIVSTPDPSLLEAKKPKPLKLEPEVPFLLIDRETFKAEESFDYVVVSISPNFTPFKSEGLLPIIKQYIRLC